MRSVKKTVITIQTWQRTTIQKRTGRIFAWCERCLAATKKYTPDEAAEIVGTNAPTVYRLIEDGVFHSTETDAGATLVCGDSIQRCLESRL